MEDVQLVTHNCRCDICGVLIFSCFEHELTDPHSKKLEEYKLAFLKHYNEKHRAIAKKARPWKIKDEYWPHTSGGRADGN